MSIILQLFSSLTLFICLSYADEFSPDTADYNAYGLKVAANDFMIVEAQNDYNQFLIQFNPYTDNVTQSDQRSCVIYDDDFSNYFIYAVALGKNQSRHFFFVGEMIGLEEDDEVENRTFVGYLNYTESLTNIECEESFEFFIEFVEGAYIHQERLVIVADPIGSVVYGFSDLFTFSYTMDPYDLVVHQNNSLSPSTSFLPIAIDYDGNRGIIAGFLDNGRNSRIQYRTTIILFSINTLTAIATRIDSWTYPINGTTWQAGLTNAGAEQYAAKFDMSVNINPTTKQVLVGIQSMNTVFLFSYTTTTLTLITSIDNDRGIGFGKGVAWLSDTLNSIAILANVYSTNYVWSSSKIYIYDSPFMNNSTPVSVFPSLQQPLYSFMSSVFLNIITTPKDLVLIDELGYLFVIVSVPGGYYASTVGPDVEISPAFSSQLSCIPGTYKNVTGIRRCLPCPTGTKNDGINPTITTCVNCATDTFCPFGSTTDSISNDQLNNITQAIAYQKSPDITGLDDILFFMLFSIGSGARCVVLSPIFWTLIVTGIIIIIIIVMLIIRYCFKQPKAVKVLKKVFKQSDLIREGNQWTGGLATLCVMVLTISCIIISAKYYYSYPFEVVGPSTYACDTTIRNSQFSSTLQSSSVPVAENMKGMIDVLNDQQINLNVAFLNTIYNCTSDSITLTYRLGSTWPLISNVPCNRSNYILSYSALLPFRPINVRFTLPNIYTIGGLRIGLSGPGQNKSSTTTLQDLGFSQIFSQNGRMLGQDVRINLQLTKVINNTNPLVSGDDEILSGIWIGSFTINYYESFITDTEYLFSSPGTPTYLTVDISETPYYILNEQSPIARLPEIVYHDFLFITMIIGMFVLIFVLMELIVFPLANFLIRKCRSKPGEKYETDSSRRSSSTNDDLENPTSNSKRQVYMMYGHGARIPDNLTPL